MLPVILAVLAAYGAAPQQEKRRHFSFADKREAYDRQEVVSAVAVSSPQSEGRYTIFDEIWKPRFFVSPIIMPRTAKPSIRLGRSGVDGRRRIPSAEGRRRGLHPP